VQADFAVELGADDETLEMPWVAEVGSPKYYNLKRELELLREVEEVQQFGELGDFLTTMNSATSMVETAKCDVWVSTEINPEEEVFGEPCKFGSYVDVLFSDEELRFSFPEHELWAKRLTALLEKTPDIAATAEFLIRRCHYHGADGTRDGFYITFYMFGYGEDEAQARQRWAIGLKLAENAIRQMLQV
jgi:hypothetical protein